MIHQYTTRNMCNQWIARTSINKCVSFVWFMKKEREMNRKLATSNFHRALYHC